MARPELTGIETIDLFGGSRTIIAHVDYDGEQMTAMFTGRQRDRPGHVDAVVAGERVPVPHPERYGDRFNKEWVEEYWRRNTDG